MATEESTVSHTNQSIYTGLEKLRKIKKEMEVFYKELLKVIFLDSVDKAQAILLENKMNMLIMSVND